MFFSVAFCRRVILSFFFCLMAVRIYVIRRIAYAWLCINLVPRVLRFYFLPLPLLCFAHGWFDVHVHLLPRIRLVAPEINPDRACLVPTPYPNVPGPDGMYNIRMQDTVLSKVFYRSPHEHLTGSKTLGGSNVEEPHCLATIPFYFPACGSC